MKADLTGQPIQIGNIDLEQELIGVILNNPELMGVVSAHVDGGDFHYQQARLIYQAIEEMSLLGEQINLVAVCKRLESGGNLDRVGRLAGIRQLCDQSAFSSIPVEEAAKQIREYAHRRRLADLFAVMTRMVHDPTEPLPRVHEYVQEKIAALINQRSTYSQIGSIKDAFSQAFDLISTNYEAQGITGIPTGFIDLDEVTVGLHRGELIIVGGRPAMGKTSFGLQIAQSVATLGKCVVFFSLEMSMVSLAMRNISSMTGIPITRLRRGTIRDTDWDKIGNSMAEIERCNLWINDATAITLSQLKGDCTRIQMMAQKPIDLIMVDYLQLMTSGSRRQSNRAEELGAIAQGLKDLSKDMNCTVIALSQLSRESEKRSNRRPMLTDLRESGGIEQAADVVMLLHREDYYDPNTPDRGIAEVILAKHRNGPTGTIKLLFDAQLTTFRNL